MRKITVEFTSIPKIKKLRKIMQEIYRAENNNHRSIGKFNLKKELTPSKIKKIELVINKLIGSNAVITIPKTSLTFLAATAPHNIVEPNSEIRDNYIVLPWKIEPAEGREELKKIIGKISEFTTNIRYTIYEDNISSAIVPIASAEDTISNAELSLSENSFEDNTEELFTRITELETRMRNLDQNLTDAKAEIARQQNLVRERDAQIINLNNQATNLNSQVSNLNNQISSLNNQITQKQNQINSLQSSNNSYSSQITQLRNSNQYYNMTLTGTGNATGIGNNWLNFVHTT